LLLHIVDIASETAAQQFHTVEGILKDLGLAEKPVLVVLNKIDLLGGEIDPCDNEAVRRYIDQLGARVQAAAFVSAAKGWGLNRMLELIAEMLEKLQMKNGYRSSGSFA
jgi:GTP-binding protein HflX